MLPQARVSWDAVTFLEPEQPVPRQEWGGAEEMGEMCLQRSPLPWSPVNGTPISRSRGGSPRAQSSLEHPDHSWAAGQEGLWCVTWSLSPLWCGSQQQLPSLELPSPRTPAPSGAQSREVLGFWGSAGEGEKSQTTLAHSTLIYSHGTQLSLGLRLPKKLEGSMEDCRALVDVSCNNSLKTG